MTSEMGGNFQEETALDRYCSTVGTGNPQERSLVWLCPKVRLTDGRVIQHKQDHQELRSLRNSFGSRHCVKHPLRVRTGRRPWVSGQVSALGPSVRKGMSVTILLSPPHTPPPTRFPRRAFIPSHAPACPSAQPVLLKSYF